MMDADVLVRIVAIICLTVIVVTLLARNIDGAIASSICSLIAWLAGYGVRKTREGRPPINPQTTLRAADEATGRLKKTLSP
jgi:xanthine/uracil/vitamin C permease (AzgA family)